MKYAPKKKLILADKQGVVVRTPQTIKVSEVNFAGEYHFSEHKVLPKLERKEIKVT